MTCGLADWRGWLQVYYKRIRGRLALVSLDLIEKCRKSNSRYQLCDTGLETDKCKLGVARTFLAWEKNNLWATSKREGNLEEGSYCLAQKLALFIGFCGLNYQFCLHECGSLSAPILPAINLWRASVCQPLYFTGKSLIVIWITKSPITVSCPMIARSKNTKISPKSSKWNFKIALFLRLSPTLQWITSKTGVGHYWLNLLTQR